MKTPRRPLVKPFTPGTTRDVTLSQYYYGPIDTTKVGEIAAQSTPVPTDSCGGSEAANQVKRERRGGNG